MRIAALLLALLLAGPAASLAAPFDMSGERKGEVTEPDKTDVEPVVDVPEVKAPPPVVARYLVPFQKLTLSGEIASRNWMIYLTPGQAASALKFNYGYRNAIFVAPETSKISVYVNDTLISDLPIQSPNGISERSIDLPSGLLQPGANTISLRAIQQHRTDCTIESTFQLWTEIIPDKTYLALDPAAPKVQGSIEDVKAIGVDKAGRSRFRIVVPRLQQQRASDAVMRLSQALALLGRMPNQSFSVSETVGNPDGPGELTVVVGPAEAVGEVLPALPEAARDSAFMGFVSDSRSGKPVMVLSGPDWQAVQNVIEGMTSSLDRPESIQRDTLLTQAWTGSETPFLRAGTSLSFAKLGVATTEFTGRRFRAGFEIGVPADFYADAYGEAQILLDAAYSQEILPGSHIDVYVNGNIAATVPITSTSGGILRHLPIRVTMRHFRPGDNLIEIEAILRARSDIACVPGTSSSPRFALFNSSEFRMPDFARIAELPNLSAVSGTGFPYGRERKDITLFLERTDARTLSASATLLGKLAVAAGRPIPVITESSPVRVGDNNAIFIGAISQIPPAALTQVHLADTSRTAWGNLSAQVTQGSSNEDALDEWKSRVRGGSWLGEISAFEDWMRQTFDISLGSLQFLPAREDDTLPPHSSTFLMAQGLSPEGGRTWTVVAAPTGAELQSGMDFMSDQQNWRDLAGKLVMFDNAKKAVVSLPASRTYLVETQSFSFLNYRLIAANWLSTNILSYAALFGGVSILLGLATSALLNAFGRRH